MSSWAAASSASAEDSESGKPQHDETKKLGKCCSKPAVPPKGDDEWDMDDRVNDLERGLGAASGQIGELMGIVFGMLSFFGKCLGHRCLRANVARFFPGSLATAQPQSAQTSGGLRLRWFHPGFSCFKSKALAGLSGHLNNRLYDVERRLAVVEGWIQRISGFAEALRLFISGR